MALAIATNNAALRAAAVASGVNRDMEPQWLGCRQASVLTVRQTMPLVLLFPHACPPPHPTLVF